MTKQAEIIKTNDLNYNQGYVMCNCGWVQKLGDGFNGYHISSCPNCDKTIDIRNQRKVIYGDGENKQNMSVDIGENWYFVLTNGINVRYKKNVHTTTGLSMRQADDL